MSIEIRIPEVGESIEEVTLEEWLKKEGDTVEEDEPIAVLESDKVTIELPSPQSGTLESIDRKAGEQCGVGDVIARLSPSADGAGESTEKKQETKQEKKKEKQEKKQERKQPRPEEETEQEFRGVSEEKGERDERKAAESTKHEDEGREEQRAEEEESRRSELPDRTAAEADRGEEVVPMSPIRRKIAARLLEAQRNAALLTTFNKADMSRVLELRRRYREAFQERYGVKLGIMSFFVKAAVAALRQTPGLNAEVRDENIVYRNYFDIGIAIASEKGLVVPVLRNAGRLSMAGIEQQIRDFAERAEAKRLKLSELEGGTFTISNGGVFGSTFSTPILNPPQSGILGLHAIEDQPVAVDGEVVVRPVMYLALSYDHRIVDGREAVTFLRLVKEAVEEPASLLFDA